MTLAILFGSAALVSVVLYIFFGRDHKVSPVLTEKPPEGMTPAEAGVILRGRVKAADIPALILFWANKGYLAFDSVSEGGEDELHLIKIKDADSGMKPHEKQLFDRIFHGVSNVALRDLKDMRELRTQAAHALWSPGAGLYTLTGFCTAVICAVLAGLCTGLKLGLSAARQTDLGRGIIFGILTGAVTIGLCFLLRFFAGRAVDGKKRGVVIAGIVYLAALILVAWMCGFTRTALLAAACAAVCGAASVLSKKHMKKSGEQLGELFGLYQLITTGEKSKIEALAAENPLFFYEILPFAYILGVADRWVGQFKDIAIPKPAWYQIKVSGGFTPVSFVHLMNCMSGGGRPGENAFAIGAFAANRGFLSGSRNTVGGR